MVTVSHAVAEESWLSRERDIVLVRYSAGEQALDRGDIPGGRELVCHAQEQGQGDGRPRVRPARPVRACAADTACRPLGNGLFELRFTCEGTARRVTYFIDTRAKVITLTTFRKQRQNERREVARARQAMRASQQAGGTNG